ncbi:MAG: C25 family cysteine peptidase [Bacteroidales bacterium]|jgi:hypothetical protein|nr:C25 family cysteine peptidase [Bacteroidales bacterium]
MKKYIIIFALCLSIFRLGAAQEKLHFDFSSLQIDTVSVGNDSFLLLSDKTLPYTTEISGQPLIPCYNQLISLPLGAELKVKYNVSYGQNVQMNKGWKLYPKQPDLMKNEAARDFVIDESYYTLGLGNDTSAVKIKDLGIAKNHRLYLIRVLPAAYLPVENRLVRYNSIDVDIMTVNQQDMVTKSLVEKTQPMKMIIVSPEEFRQTLQPFVKWKTQEGIRITEVYPSNVSGSWTAANIKQYLQTLWDGQTQQEPFADFLLLCGDVAQLPAFNGTTESHVTDLYYADYTSDAIADVLYGRFSAQTVAQMEAIVNKTIAYEKFQLSDTSYLNNVLLVGGQETADYAIIDANGQLNYAKMYLSNLDTAIYYNVTENDSLPGGQEHFNDVLARLNAGNSFVNYTAHCSSSGWYQPTISSSHVNSMPQNGNIGFYINNCCSSGKFDDNQCFAEALLRGENKGAIGVISASNSTYWDGDWIFAVGNKAEVWFPLYDSTALGLYDRTFHTHSEPRSEYAMTQAEIMQAGNLSVMQAQKNYALYYREIYHLFGDPSLMPYIGMPQSQSIDLPVVLPLGTNSLNLNAEPFSYIGLSIGDSLLTAGRANALGQITLSFNTITNPCYLRIVATLQGYRPFIDSILVQALNTPYLAIINPTFITEDYQQATKFYCDSTYTLNFDLWNYGLQTANDVQVTLLPNDNYILLDSIANAGTLANNQSISLTDLFSFRIMAGLPNKTEIKLPVRFNGTNYSAYDTLILPVAAPKLDIKNVVFDFEGTYPYIAFQVVNKGDAVSETGEVSLSELSAALRLADTETKSLHELQPEESQGFIFQIEFADSLTTDTTFSFRISVAANLYHITRLFEDISIIPNVETFETGDFSAFDWQQNTFPWIIDSTITYQGTYSARSGIITDDQTSSLILSLKSIGEDEISFYVKTSTEHNYDKFYFYIDGIKKLSLDGEHEWQQYIFPINEGEHQFKWEYVKDYSVSYGSDAVWIDNVKLPRTATIAGLLNLSETKNINIYPNPAKDILNVDNLSANTSIYIMDLNGKIYYKGFVTGTNNTAIDLSQIPNGFYMICIKSNKALTTQKLIIAK